MKDIKGGKRKKLKRTIKFLAQCHSPKLISHIIKISPDNVTKTICNAALNAAKGEVILKPKQKKILATHRAFINSLIQKGQGIPKKKRILLQKGGSIIGQLLPTLLRAVISNLGSRFI